MYYHAYYIYCSQSAVEYSKEFVTSIVVGKDVVPRIGLHQMETLRHDLMNALQKSKEPKVIEMKFLNQISLCILWFYEKDTFIYLFILFSFIFSGGGCGEKRWL